MAELAAVTGAAIGAMIVLLSTAIINRRIGAFNPRSDAIAGLRSLLDTRDAQLRDCNQEIADLKADNRRLQRMVDLLTPAERDP